MKNTVTGSIHFSFKGTRHAPSVTIELDRHIELTGTLPDFYPLIAKENNFDLYSYEYEMMQAEEILFTRAEGLVADFINDGHLDIDGFTTAWKEKNILSKLQKIAKQHMNTSDFQQHTELKNALLDAYTLGTKATK